jgi:hypothetical protein
MTALPHETWVNNKWRPAMGWTYMVICVFDFIIFPLIWMWVQQLQGTAVTQWSPLTMDGAGMFHVAMGAVIGVTAWQRSQEKITATKTETES